MRCGWQGRNWIRARNDRYGISRHLPQVSSNGLPFGGFAVDAHHSRTRTGWDGGIIFSEAKRSAFWVVEAESEIVGSFGIESRSADDVELRRMYLDQGYRGAGIAQRMLDFALVEARARGFTKMILSTAQIQKAADRFYRKSGFRLIATEVADQMTAKQAGGGLTRFHFEKVL
jgi:GNAT superfamily N-acetyltransferase